MKLQLKALSIALGAATLMAGSAWGEATSTSGPFAGGPYAATARLNVTIAVPKVVILRVGALGGAIDTVAFTSTVGSVAVGGPSGYSGAIPPTSSGVTSTGSPVVVQVYTNNGSADLTCSSAAMLPATAGGPTLSDVTVTNGLATVAHPGANLTCVGLTALAGMTPTTSRDDSWTYALAGTPFAAGAYSTQVTYTATTP